MDTNNSGGEMLRKLRIEKGESLFKVARATHISGNYLSLIERGFKKPSSTVITALSEYYSFPEAKLFLLFNRIPPEEEKLLLNIPALRKTMIHISVDERLTEEDQEALRTKLHTLYLEIIDNQDSDK